MVIKLIRTDKSDKSTIGELYIDGIFECYTLEDVERPNKIYGKTAIPKGKYKVIITYSNRFKKDLPLLLNIPNYEGIRIHSGNKAEDTEGCILVGTSKSKDWISGSKSAFSKLLPKLKSAKSITITIE